MATEATLPRETDEPTKEEVAELLAAAKAREPAPAPVEEAREEAAQDVIRTPSGIVSREEYTRLQEEYPEGIPSTAVERVVEERTEPLPFEVARAKRKHQEDIASIKDLTKRKDAALFRTLTDREQFDKAVELGLVEEGSQYVPAIKVDWSKSGLTTEEIRKRQARITKITGKPTDTWAYFTPEQVAEIKEAKAQAKRLTKIKKRHLTELQLRRQAAFIKSLADLPPTFSEAFKEGGVEGYKRHLTANYTQLPDKQWINKEQLANLEATAPPLYKALTTSGFDAADKVVAKQQKVLAKLPTETFREQYIRLYDKEPPTIGAFEEEEVSFIDKYLSFYTGRGTGELARGGSEFLKGSIPGFIAGMSNAQYQTQIETERLYRYFFKEQIGRFPTLGEMPDIKAGLPRGIQVASVVPGVVTAYRWDTMSKDQKWQAIQDDIAMAVIYGIMAIGLKFQPGRVPIVNYKLVNEFGVPTGRAIKIPVYAPDTLGTKFAIRNPALWQRGATPLKIYGETGIKPITPLLGPRELILRKPQMPVLPSTYKGGVRIPSGLIPPTHIPPATYYPGASYTTARGIKINLPAGTIKTGGLIPSGMEIWSRKGIEQPWNPFAHTGARVIVTPVTGELTIVDVATGRTRNIGFPSAGAGVAVGAAPREPSTLTMTPEQLAKLKPLVTPTPYIEYEITPSGLVAPKIIPYPKPKQLVAPGISPVISPAGKPSPAVVPSPVVAPVPSVTPTPTPIVAVSPAVIPSPAIAAKPGVAPARVPARVPVVAPIGAPVVKPVAISVPISDVPTLLSRAEMKGRELTKKERKSAVAWPQGFGWWIVFRRGGKRFRFFHYGQQPPQGIKQVKQGEGEAARGIQQHKGVAPVSFKLPLGVVDVRVESPGKEPGKVGAIGFTPTRISSGMPQITPPRPNITPKRGRIG